MCLLTDDNDSQSKMGIRRSLAAVVILLATLSSLIMLRHVQPGPETDLFDLSGGLLVGIALAMSFFTLALCVRRPRNNSQG